jgi:hypothetical protein
MYDTDKDRDDNYDHFDNCKRRSKTNKCKVIALILVTVAVTVTVKCLVVFLSPKTINIHVVPHSHNDVGWLKTVDEYFLGEREDIQLASVEIEITSIMWALIDNPDRKFS